MQFDGFRNLSVLVAVCASITLTPVYAAGTPASEPGARGELRYRDAATVPVPVAVYLSIKQPRRSFVLAPRRKIGAIHLKRLNDIARFYNIEPVLPVLGDVLQEAMMAVRIGMGDARALSSIAEMQGAQILLAGRLNQVGYGKWQIKWTISTLSGALHWRINDVSYAAALRDGLDRISDILAGRLQVDPFQRPELAPTGPMDEQAMARHEKLSREQELGITMEAPIDRKNRWHGSLTPRSGAEQ